MVWNQSVSVSLSCPSSLETPKKTLNNPNKEMVMEMAGCRKT